VLPERPGQRLVTTDSVLWGRHFDGAVPPRSVGAKLIKRNLSDIAAMGGVPTDAVLSLVTGPNLSLAWLEDFFAGLADACRAFDVELCGGDVVAASRDFFCATLALSGFAEEKILLRRGARTGDLLMVTGELGGSLAGKHHGFVPRLAEGRWLAMRAEVHAGMDVSDGLAKDILALLPNGADAWLEPLRIPVSKAARSMVPGGDMRALLAHALNDGEDYELLVAVEAAEANALQAAWRVAFPQLGLSTIGRVARCTNGAGGRLVDASTGLPLGEDFRGYAHFG
jgi:thiamine-monophosphate kinase